MELQQALVDARIDELRTTASDVHERGNRVGRSWFKRLRVSLGLWLVGMGMYLVHGTHGVASPSRR